MYICTRFCGCKTWTLEAGSNGGARFSGSECDSSSWHRSVAMRPWNEQHFGQKRFIEGTDAPHIRQQRLGRDSHCVCSVSPVIVVRARFNSASSALTNLRISCMTSELRDMEISAGNRFLTSSCISSLVDKIGGFPARIEQDLVRHRHRNVKYSYAVGCHERA